MRIFKAQSGFSLVQGMVISAVIAGSALIATRMMTTQKMALNSAETKDQIGELHKQIFSALQNREHCFRTFVTSMASVTTNTTYTINDIKADIDGTGTGTSIFSVNTGSLTGATYMNGKVRINSMSMRTSGILGDPQPLVINYMRLEGKTASGMHSGTGFGGKSISKTINIRLQRDATTPTVLTGCYAVETAAESDTGSGNEDLNKTFCENLGAVAGQSLYTWDATRNTCVMKNNVCPDKTVFEGINSTGLAICRPFEEYIPYFLGPGTSPCPSTKSSVQLIYDPGTKTVSIQCN